MDAAIIQLDSNLEFSDKINDYKINKLKSYLERLEQL